MEFLAQASSSCLPGWPLTGSSGGPAPASFRCRRFSSPPQVRACSAMMNLSLSTEFAEFQMIKAPRGCRVNFGDIASPVNGLLPGPNIESGPIVTSLLPAMKFLFIIHGKRMLTSRLRWMISCKRILGKSVDVHPGGPLLESTHLGRPWRFSSVVHIVRGIYTRSYYSAYELLYIWSPVGSWLRSSCQKMLMVLYKVLLHLLFTGSVNDEQDYSWKGL